MAWLSLEIADKKGLRQMNLEVVSAVELREAIASLTQEIANLEQRILNAHGPQFAALAADVASLKSWIGAHLVPHAPPDQPPASTPT